jgi:hypothetical protein
MEWQDVVLAIGSLSFSVALVPTIRGASKPALLTSLLTGGWLAVFTVVYATLGLWFASISSAVTAVMWFVLAAQVVRQRAHIQQS